MSRSIIAERAFCYRKGVNYLSSASNTFAIPTLTGESHHHSKHMVLVNRVVKAVGSQSVVDRKTKVVSRQELEEHEEVCQVSTSPDGLLLAVVSSSHKMLFIDSKAGRLYKKIDLSDYSTRSVKSIIWMNARMKMVIVVWNDRFLCVSLDEFHGDNVLKYHKDVDFAFAINEGNTLCIISGERVSMVEDVLQYKEASNDTDSCSVDIKSSSLFSIPSPLSSLSLTESVTKFGAASALFDSVIAFKHSTTGGDLDSLIKSRFSSSNSNNTAVGSFKHILSGTSIRDALHVPGTEEEENSQLIIPSSNFNVNLGQGDVNIVQDINNNGSRSISLIQEVSNSCEEKIQGHNGGEQLSPKTDVGEDTGYSGTFVVHKMDGERICYTLSCSDSQEEKDIKSTDIMCCCLCANEEYLVALGSGLKGQIYVYRLYQLEGHLVKKIQLDSDHTCKGLSFLDIEQKGGNKCLHILFGMKKEGKGINGLTSVSLRGEYKLWSMFAEIDKNARCEASVSEYYEEKEMNSTDISKLIFMMNDMKQSFQSSLSKIESRLSEQSAMINQLNEKVDKLQDDNTHRRYADRMNTPTGVSRDSNNFGEDNYRHVKLNQNSPSRQYVGHIQERGKININLSRK